MNDEKSDEECEQAERREVQVEAVGQPCQVRLLLWLNEAKLVARDHHEWRRGSPHALIHDQTGKPLRPPEQDLSKTNVDNQKPRRHISKSLDRWQRLAPVGDGRRAFRLSQAEECLR